MARQYYRQPITIYQHADEAMRRLIDVAIIQPLTPFVEWLNRKLAVKTRRG